MVVTCEREKTLHKKLRVELFRHLIKYAEEELEIHTERINVQPEHVHGLILLPPNKTIASISKGLKGESSKWINEKGLVRGRFRWQRGYSAYSVSASQVETVKSYIENQDEHHKQKTFQEEYE